MLIFYATVHIKEADEFQRYRLHRFYTMLGILLCEKRKETCQYANDAMKAAAIVTENKKNLI